MARQEDRFNTVRDLQLRVEALEGSSSSGGGGGMEARVAKLESDVENIKETTKDMKIAIRDVGHKLDRAFLITWGGIIIGIIGLAGLMAKGFKWL